jgi:hypothetical protein
METTDKKGDHHLKQGVSSRLAGLSSRLAICFVKMFWLVKVPGDQRCLYTTEHKTHTYLCVFLHVLFRIFNPNLMAHNFSLCGTENPNTAYLDHTHV